MAASVAAVEGQGDYSSKLNYSSTLRPLSSSVGVKVDRYNVSSEISDDEVCVRAKQRKLQAEESIQTVMYFHCWAQS